MEEARLWKAVEEGEALRRAFFGESAAAVLEVGRVLAGSLRSGGKLLFFGNGGSAAEAQHAADEYVNRLSAERPALAAIALTADSSNLTAIGNDRGFDQIFARQIEALGRPGDVAIGISTSGNSENVREGLLRARAGGLVTVALLGGDGGRIRELADHALVVPSKDTQRVQEVHLLLEHLLCELVGEALYPGS